MKKKQKIINTMYLTDRAEELTKAVYTEAAKWDRLAIEAAGVRVRFQQFLDEMPSGSQQHYFG